LERVGKAIRNPPRDVTPSSAAQRIGGYGWAFGIHEACDQFGATAGPLVVAGVLATHGDYRLAYAAPAVPAVDNLCFLTVARLVFPRPQDIERCRSRRGRLCRLSTHRFSLGQTPYADN
jgi:hypothetical protein